MEKETRWSATRLALHGAIAIAMVAFVFLGLLPRTGLYRTLTVRSGSMEPAISAGSIVIVTPEPPRDVRVGWIITYQAPLPDKRVVSHRVVDIDEPGDHPVIRTKGDANQAEDPWNARVDGDTVWRVRRSIPFVGHVIAAFRNRIARGISLYAIPGLLAFVWVRDVWRDGEAPTRRARTRGPRRPGRHPPSAPPRRPWDTYV